jgi:hypothetical protein
MGNREFLVYLDPEKRQNRYRPYHAWEGKRIMAFRLQYEALIAGKWYAILRYDTAHGQPHKDTLHPDGSETKEWFTVYSNAEVLTIGQRDSMENWPAYRAVFEREMKP